MKTAYVIIGIIILGVVVGGVYVYSQRTTTPAVATPTATQTVTSPTTATSTPATNVPAASGTPTPQHFTVNGNDSTADVMTITVKKGTPVTITFGADAQGTYHGGLDFRSSVLNTGTIAPGSTKTVSFTANQSFVFQPYWPATNIAKPYHISIVVD
jgi:hypothetical protein